MNMDTEMTCYDLIVIGGGPGGYLAAQRAGEKGLRVVIFEKNSLGGVCLNEGCIPTKALLYSAKIYDYVNNSKAYGIECGEATYNHKAVLDKKERTVRRLVGGVKAQLKAHNVETVIGLAEIVKKENGLFSVACGGNIYLSKNLIIASGSQPAVPPINGLDACLKNGFALTSREILQLNEIPSALTVIGGGVIGLEMASYFASAGSEVTVIEMADKIAGQLDKEVSLALQKIMEKKGIKFILGARVTAFEECSISYEKDNTKHTVTADKALLSIGRKPFISGFGLENLNVKTERGAIITDERMRTNIDGLYAVGDVNGKSMLAHTAYREAEVAINSIVGIEDIINYFSVPSVIYTNPEAASCGETLEGAQQEGKIVKCFELSMMYSGRYVAENGDPSGFCRLITDENNILIGFHVLSSYASEYISTASTLIDLKIDLERAKKIIFPHPTVSEIIHEVLFTVPKL